MPPEPDFIDFLRSPRWIVRARAVCDAAGRSFAPGQLIIEADPHAVHTGLRTVGIGPPTGSDALPALDLPDSVVLPGFVNAHCHLDLTLIGPRPRPTTGGFSAWLQMIREHRPQEPADIEAAVRRGIELSLAGGVVAVGDIAGSVRSGPSLVPWRTLREWNRLPGGSAIGGVSFLEFFAFGTMRDAALARLQAATRDAGRDRGMLGLQPHAPYSVSRIAYEAAMELGERLGLPLSTHLAETLDERTFTADAAGPHRDFIESLNIWHETEAEHLCRGEHPVCHLGAFLDRSPWLLAHLNDCSEAALDRLAGTSCAVAYCPRASAYFDAPATLGPHRYRDMLARGINVCLGTDSIVNLPHAAASESTGGISPLDDARLLYRRDATDPRLLLAMLTINGARALGLDESAFGFTPGHTLAGVCAVSILGDGDPLGAVFAGNAPPRLIASSRQAPAAPKNGTGGSSIADGQRCPTRGVMSQKWQRSKAWDDQHLRSPELLPVRFLLRAFSSITLAVIVLFIVALYATVASVPIGLLALIPTWIVYAASLVVPMLLVWTVLILVVGRLRMARGARFAVGFLGIITLGVGVAFAWHAFAWPALRYESATGTGLRLWPDFVDRYSRITLRRLPGFEMTELQFYSWWPLRVILLVFVLNMFVATIRRIEFTFRNIGVLTVHTGIITIALGSVYYQKMKKEGDTIVAAGFSQARGVPGIGPPQVNFFDNTAVVLYTTQERAGGTGLWEQRPIPHLPRYNNYNLDAGGDRAVESTMTRPPHPDPWAGIPERSLSIPLDPTIGLLDPDIALRIVGYATYAELKEDNLRIDPADADGPLRPLRIVSLYLRVPDEHGHISDAPKFEITLMPSIPARRVSENPAFGIEYTLAMPEDRWGRLAAEVPENTEHALVIEVPGESPTRIVVPAVVGSTVPVGDTGYKVRVEQLSPTPPMPIITRGYEGATSSVAVVRITKPDGSGYQRWVYSRFGELNQDLLDAVGATGRPIRRDADSEIRIDYLDLSKLQMYIDETPDGVTRALIRPHLGPVRIIEGLQDGERITDVIDKLDIAVAERWENAEPFERPIPVPAVDQDTQAIGTHFHAAVAVEVTATVSGAAWKHTIWVPFSQYMGMGAQNERTVRLPDGRVLRLAFGRRQHRFPGFAVQLVDFEMIAYDYRGAPRDYQSVLRVSPSPVPGRDNPEFEAYEHVCKLNAPLRAPDHWDPEKPWISNAFRRIASGLNPDQYKLSQSGWDQQGWARTQEMVEAGQLERPFVNFTILGVGNNPGIHVIALGGILMGVGIPWAFYIKPLLIRREKNRLARAHTMRGGK